MHILGVILAYLKKSIFYLFKLLDLAYDGLTLTGSVVYFKLI